MHWVVLWLSEGMPDFQSRLARKLGNATYRADKALLCITLPTGPLGLLMMPRGANSPEAN